eukprot:g2026.t1
MTLFSRLVSAGGSAFAFSLSFAAAASATTWLYSKYDARRAGDVVTDAGEVVDEGDASGAEDDGADDFDNACRAVRGLSLTQEQQLRFYGLFKQATAGECGGSQPSALAFEARAKWDAWHGCAGMSQAEARAAYVDALRQNSKDGAAGGGGGGSSSGGGGGGGGGLGGGMRAVSTMAAADEARERAARSSRPTGERACYELARDGEVEALTALLERAGAGASVAAEVNACDSESGLSALHYAADRGHVEAARLLLSHGAKIEGRDADGLTPLHTAVLNDQLDIVRMLLDRGADPATRDDDGDSPLANADGELKQLLLQAIEDSLLNTDDDDEHRA